MNESNGDDQDYDGPGPNRQTMLIVALPWLYAWLFYLLVLR